MRNVILEAPVRTGIHYYPPLIGHIEDIADHCNHKKFSIWIHGLSIPYAKLESMVSQLQNENFVNWSSLPPDIRYTQGQMASYPRDTEDSTFVWSVTFFWEDPSQPHEFSVADRALIESQATRIVSALRAT